MLKIYFDWNCITHSKDKYSYILQNAKEYGNRFIFPFSNAHIRDVLVSQEKGNEYFESDVKILEEVCGKHYLLFEEDRMMPKFATPTEVINVSGDLLESIQKTEIITPKRYTKIKEEIKKHLPSDVYMRIQGASPSTVISTIDLYISKELPNQNLESLLSSHQPNIGLLINAESRFKTMCLALDMLGFRPEKKDKHPMNIDTDASHIFYAGHCDVFVTADRKLRDKAEAMYRKYNYQTRILHPEEFESFIINEVQKEYSLKYISKVIDEYGTPRIEDDGAHYKLLPHQVFGTFNVCHKLEKPLMYDNENKVGLFRYCFNNTPYIFHTEIKHFFNFIENLLQPSEKALFNKNFAEPFISEDYDAIPKAGCLLDCKDFNLKIGIYLDPEIPTPIPMMVLEYGDKFEKLYCLP